MIESFKASFHTICYYIELKQNIRTKIKCIAQEVINNLKEILNEKSNSRKELTNYERRLNQGCIRTNSKRNS